MGLVTFTSPTIGADRGTEEIDVLNALIALGTEFNGAINTDNLAPSAKPVTLLGVYRAVASALTIWYDTLSSGNTYMFARPSLLGSGISGEEVPLVPLAAADYLPSSLGLAVRGRLRASLQCNQVAPARTFTIGLYPITVAGTADALNISLGTVVPGSAVAIVSPPANLPTMAVGADFALPADGVYAFGAIVSGTPTADSHGTLAVRLDVHHIP